MNKKMTSSHFIRQNKVLLSRIAIIFGSPLSVLCLICDYISWNESIPGFSLAHLLRIIQVVFLHLQMTAHTHTPTQ